MAISDKRQLPHPEAKRTKEVARHRNRLGVAVKWVKEGCPSSLVCFLKEHGLSGAGARKLEGHPVIQEMIAEQIRAPARRGLASVVQKLEKRVKTEGDELEVLDLTRAGDFLGEAAFDNFRKKDDEDSRVQVTINLPQAGGVHMSVEDRQKIEDDWEKHERRIIDV